MKRMIFLILGLVLMSSMVSADLFDYIDSGQTSESTYDNYDETQGLEQDVNNIFSVPFYGFTFNSRFTNFFKIRDGTEDDSAYVSFGYDLNNLGGLLFDDTQYLIDEKYTFNNWIRSTTDDLTKIEAKATSSNNVNDNDYFGLPIEIRSCYIDCDTSDEIPKTQWNMDTFSPYGDVWYMDIQSYSGPSASWIQQRFPYDNQFFDRNSVFRFQHNDYKCQYDSGGVKTIEFGCVFQKNPLYRHDSENDEKFSFNEISDVFTETNDNIDTTTLKITTNIDIDYLNYTSSPVDVSDTSSSGGSTAPPEQINLQMMESDIQLQQIATQESFWQSTILNIENLVLRMFIIIFYIVSLIASIVVMIGIFPFMFYKLREKIEKLVDVKNV